jgi:ribosome-associated protein
MADADSYLEITEELRIPLTEFDFAYVRSSGPGGQNVNKVNSQVQLAWDLTGNTSLPAEALERLKRLQRGRITKAGVLRIAGQRYRDRERNKQDCLERLRTMIVAALEVPKKRRPTRTPRRAKEQRLRQKQARADVKQTRRKPRMDD